LQTLEKLIKGDSFHDAELEDADTLTFQIVEDHIYIIYRGTGSLVVASDIGNGHATVIEALIFDNQEELGIFVDQDWKKYSSNLE